METPATRCPPPPLPQSGLRGQRGVGRTPRAPWWAWVGGAAGKVAESGVESRLPRPWGPGDTGVQGALAGGPRASERPPWGGPGPYSPLFCFRRGLWPGKGGRQSRGSGSQRNSSPRKAAPSGALNASECQAQPPAPGAPAPPTAPPAGVPCALGLSPGLEGGGPRCGGSLGPRAPTPLLVWTACLLLPQLTPPRLPRAGPPARRRPEGAGGARGLHGQHDPGLARPWTEAKA